MKLSSTVQRARNKVVDVVLATLYLLNFAGNHSAESLRKGINVKMGNLVQLRKRTPFRAQVNSTLPRFFEQVVVQTDSKHMNTLFIQAVSKFLLRHFI